MRPIKLTISAFGPYASKQVIDFEELNGRNIFVISGKTGAGKTTIFDAITFALFGEASGDNREANMLRSKFYVCPICGNVIRTSGETLISCCGITLPALEAEDVDEHHEITVEKVEDESFFTVNHDMTKTHFISFIAHLTSDRVQFVKFYPEGNAETRLQLRGRGYLYIFCNKHGLMKKKI